MNEGKDKKNKNYKRSYKKEENKKEQANVGVSVLTDFMVDLAHFNIICREFVA